MAVGDGRLQPPGGFGNGVRRSDAERIEAFRPRQRLDQAAELFRLQKSSFS
jgi:hypothetical protein